MALGTAKKTFFASKIKASGGNPSVMWRFVKQTLNSDTKGNSVGISSIRGRNGSIVSDTQSIANEFNNFFLDIGRNPCSGELDTCFTKIANSVFFSPVTELDIRRSIGALNSKNSKDLYGISNFLLKLACPHVSACIAFLVNLMFASGRFPMIFKRARVSLIFKSGDCTSMKNYRPIAILSVVGKLFENIIHKQLYNFFESNGLLSHKQFGFRQGRGTETAVASLVNSINLSINEQKYVGMVSLDVSKAFDSVNHCLLLKKLDCLGVRGVALDLIASYFKGRTQFVRIDGVSSSEKLIEGGVPQGSVLGPLLFIIFLNDIIKHALGSDITIYADDVAVYVTGRDIDVVLNSLQVVIDNLLLWYERNGLLLNGDKSTFVIFGSPYKLNSIAHKLHTLVIDIKGNFLLPQDNVKYLGVLLDKSLKWLDHIALIRNKLARLIGAFYRLRMVFEKSVLMMLFNSLFQTHIRYCILSYGSTHKSKLRPIFALHRRVVRVINFIGRYDSVDRILREDRIPSIFHISLIAISVTASKIWAGTWCGGFIPLSRKVRVHNYDLRNSERVYLDVPNVSNDWGRFSLSCRAPVILNRLMDVHCDVLSFKSAVVVKRRVSDVVLNLSLDCLESWF